MDDDGQKSGHVRHNKPKIDPPFAVYDVTMCCNKMIHLSPGSAGVVIAWIDGVLFSVNMIRFEPRHGRCYVIWYTLPKISRFIYFVQWCSVAWISPDECLFPWIRFPYQQFSLLHAFSLISMLTCFSLRGKRNIFDYIEKLQFALKFVL